MAKMKFVHPAFFYHLMFKVTRPRIQHLVSETEKNVLTLHGLHSKMHPMGGRAFFFHHAEVGHIHWNGNLDIIFGRQLTSELLKLDKIQQHRFVPESAITFPVHKRGDIAFALSLLRFSYLRILRNRSGSTSEWEMYMEREEGKLPGELRKIVAHF
jgi:hypothetical protein